MPDEVELMCFQVWGCLIALILNIKLNIFNIHLNLLSTFFVDNGSTDDSTAIAQSYAQKYPKQMGYLEHKEHHNR